MTAGSVHSRLSYIYIHTYTYRVISGLLGLLTYVQADYFSEFIYIYILLFLLGLSRVINTHIDRVIRVIRGLYLT